MSAPSIADRTPVCVCGARLRWVRYVPRTADPTAPVSGEGLSVLPLDWRQARPMSPAWRTANYAVGHGTVLARQITPARPLDGVTEWGPFNVHYATCPAHVTPDELSRMSTLRRRHR